MRPGTSAEMRTSPLLGSTRPVAEAAHVGRSGVAGLSAAVPVEQYRKEYLFTAPLSYAVNLATIIAKPGTTVTVDGVRIEPSAFVAVGDFMVATITLDGDPSDPNSAVHDVSADQKVGLIVYGYGLYTSYMYPGGADLARIAIPILI